jgi:hypothetical protein
VITDEEVIETYKKLGESLRQENAIIEIDINTEDFFEFAKNLRNNR